MSRDPLTMCVGKQAHPSPEVARRIAERMGRRRRRRKWARRMNIYRCPFCDAWHVGHGRGQGKRKAAA